MKEWLTAREIAEEGLLDMPSSESGVIRFAKENDWAHYTGSVRQRAGRGGGVEYHIRLLPMLAQMDYTRRHLVVAELPAPQADEPDATPLSERARKERDARLAILAAYSKFLPQLMGKGARISQFCSHYKAEMIQVDAWVRQTLPVISRRSLERWIADKANNKLSKPGFDRSLNRKGKGVLDIANDGRVRQFILGMIAHQPHLSASHVMTLCRHEFGDHLKVVSKGVEKTIPMPPVRTFQHTLAELKSSHKVELTKLTNPDKYRSVYAPAGIGMLRHVTEPNALWQIDASPVDALCTDGRHAVYACIDIATRRTIFSLSKTPRASAVALLIRKAILAWGVPDTIKTDNGSDFVAQDTKRLFAALDIEMELSEAYTPQQKGHVERVIKTFQHDMATLLPGFIGHSVADRKAIENRKSFAERLGETDAETFSVSLTGPELAVHIDEWAALIYAKRDHAGLKGKSPMLAAAASMRPVRTVDERALDLLLMPVAGKDGLRTVTKFGIRIDHFHYMTPHVLPGTLVLVRQDPMDMGKAYVFAADGGQYLGQATCPELAGINPQAFVKEAKAIQAERIADATRQIKADMKKIASGPSLIERVLDVAKRDAPNVISLPKREEIHSNAQISAAIEAMSETIPAAKPWEDMDARERRVASEAAWAERDRVDFDRTLDTIQREFEARVAEDRVAGLPDNAVRLPETAKERFKRALAIDKAIDAKEPVDPGAVVWVTHYKLTPEYKGERVMFEDFGDAYLS